MSAELPFHYLAVDGPIGVGKTTLVERLCERFEGVKLLEDVDNPFLADFYSDRPGPPSRPSSTSCCRATSSSSEVVPAGALPAAWCLADYTFQKDRIFAYLTLTDDELSLYDKLYKRSSRRCRRRTSCST